MGLALPVTTVPSNLSLRPGARATLVDSDLYDICRRVAEVDPNLFILELEGDGEHSFAIWEHCRDGVDRQVYKVRELDGRVVEKLRYMMDKPLSERYEQLEREEHRLIEEQKENDFEELYESMGRPMWTELERTGFIQRPISYPKLGVTRGGR